MFHLSLLRTGRAVLAVSSLSLGATAQSVLVVDGLNRPGANFTDLPAAEAAARDGDVISVRTDGGNYTAIQTQKALTLVSTVAQAFIRTTSAQPFVVSGIPAGRQFTMRGFLLGPTNGGGPLLQVSNCAGRVVLDQLEIGIGFPSIAIQSCAGVLLQESRVLGGFPSLTAQNSVLECVQSTLQGGGADARFNQFSAPAVDLRQCRATFTGCSLDGGIGRTTLGPAPALVLASSTVTAGAVAGLGSLSAGPPGGSTGTASAVVGQASSLRVDPALPITPTGAVPPVVGVTLAPASFPGLLVDTHLRSVNLLSVRDIPGRANVLLVGLPAGPATLPGVAGDLWIDPNAFVMQVGVPQAVGTPALPVGMVLVAQVAALSTIAGVELSNANVLVVR